MHGKHHSDKAKIVDLEYTSCGIGGVIPDPMLMTVNAKRISGFSQDLTKMCRRTFTHTGDNWNQGNGFYDRD